MSTETRRQLEGQFIYNVNRETNTLLHNTNTHSEDRRRLHTQHLRGTAVNHDYKDSEIIRILLQNRADEIICFHSASGHL